MIDSAAIQEIVTTITGTGTQLIPAPYSVFASVISALATAITAAIIRHVERKKLLKCEAKKRAEIIQAALNKDENALREKIDEIKKR